MTTIPKAPYYPIIYVRGYAATMGEIEETVSTPYMGFNKGSTKLRQDYEGKPVRFIFESPLVRLMKDEQYVDAYKDGDFIEAGKPISPKSIWIFRYYEKVSDELGEDKRMEIEQFASDLREFILLVRDRVCRKSQIARNAFKVHLVAHSMGGLICRCYLQKICRKGTGDADLDSKLELLNRPSDPLVDKVFTYATPHNGIEMLGINAPDVGVMDRLQASNFNRKRMAEYLDLLNANKKLPKKFKGRVDSLNDCFPKERFFCFVGTNYRDYQAFSKLSKKGTGPNSDGLVMMRNATADKAPRAFAHRSHSGHYGIVNSEEGYQNLRRFLFGETAVKVLLQVDEITLPPALEKEDKKLKRKGKKVLASYNIEASAGVRGAGCFLSERSVSQESAIRRTDVELLEQQKRVYLFSGYLLNSAKTKDDKDKEEPLSFAIHVGVEVPVYEVDRKFWFDDHYEGCTLLDETITCQVNPGKKNSIMNVGLASRLGVGQVDPTLQVNRKDLPGGGVQLEIPLGFEEGATDPPKPGFRGRLLLQAHLREE